ncbi:MAG: response regulator [Candidatus Caldatribacteriota bacterium]
MQKEMKNIILLVEDNPDGAELIIRVLKKQGLINEIFQVEDGEEALEFIFGQGRYAQKSYVEQIKLILLDLKLPKLNGLEVLEKIKTNPSTAKLPVVILTSSTEDPDINKAYELGVNSYVVKPVDFEDFVNAVHQTGLYWLLINKMPER